MKTKSIFFLLILAACSIAIAAPDSESPMSQPQNADVVAGDPQDAEYQFNQGVIYAQGEAVPQDNALAVQWFTKAAEQGHAAAQHNLGLMNEQGLGVRQDAEKAFQWFSKAAEQGYAESEYCLGRMYVIGEGVKTDYAKALEWYNKAAVQGNDRAQLSLGLLYAQGEGVPQDNRQAYSWFSLAVLNGSEGAVKNREWITPKLSDVDIQQAQVFIDAFLRQQTVPPKSKTDQP
jgi:hypothetical protein